MGKLKTPPKTPTALQQQIIDLAATKDERLHTLALEVKEILKAKKQSSVKSE
jgi:hypothetical protein